MANIKQCMKCGKPATTKITKLDNYNKVLEIFLCDEHAQAFRPYFRKAQPANLVEILQQFFKQDNLTEATGGKQPGGPVCSSCGLPYSAYRKTLLLGCSDCYRHFERLLLPDMQRMHGATSNDPLYEVETEKAGAIVEMPPHAQEAAQHAPSRLEDLRGQLEEAIAGEDFERAAQLRDAIREEEAGQQGRDA